MSVKIADLRREAKKLGWQVGVSHSRDDWDVRILSLEREGDSLDVKAKFPHAYSPDAKADAMAVIRDRQARQGVKGEGGS